MVDQELFDAIRRFRKENLLTQNELAAYLGVNQKTVSRWERGVDQPSPEIRERLMKLLREGGESQPAFYEAIRTAAVPIALVDADGKVLVASPSYGAPEQKAAPGTMPTVLVIEDDELVLKATQAVLRRWHFLSVGATNGQTALDMVTSGKVRPSAAIIDFLLPGPLDGIDTAIALRQAIPNLPVLIVSGEATPERMKKIQASGLTFISKPVDTEAVKTALAALVAGNS